MKPICSSILSLIAIVLAIVALCVSCPRTDMSFDYLGLITGSTWSTCYSLGWMEYLHDNRL